MGGEGVGGVNIVVAGDAERSGVVLIGDMSGGLLVDLAEGYARVVGGELVGSMDLGVTRGAEEGGVGATVEAGSGRLAGIAELGSHGW